MLQVLQTVYRTTKADCILQIITVLKYFNRISSFNSKTLHLQLHFSQYVGIKSQLYLPETYHVNFSEYCKRNKSNKWS